MTLAITHRPLHRFCLFASVFLLLPLSAYPQTKLTGAVQFSTNSTGAFSGAQIWNTLGGDLAWNLWLALDPAATSPVNGPSDAQAAIAIPLEPGHSYKYYTFGQPNLPFSFNGLNLFFNGNNSTPGISVFGHIDSPDFLPNTGSSVTLDGVPVAGSGSTTYNADGVVVVLDGYEWHTPQAGHADVCEVQFFIPGNGPDFFGSIALQVYPAASLSLSQAGNQLAMAGSGFTPLEPITISIGRIGVAPLVAISADANGSFTVTHSEAQRPYGPLEVFALGQSSGKLGVATASVKPGLVLNSTSALPGGTTAVQGSGFGAAETVSIYWNNPRQLLGTATANGEGSFGADNALAVAIPADASPGSNAVIGIGQTTNATGTGHIEVK